MQEKSKDSFWAIVKDCLVEFHSLTPAQAASQIREYRKQVTALKIENAIYHDEPYEIVCDIAGVSSKSKGRWARYLAIKKLHLSPPSNVVEMPIRTTTPRQSKSALRQVKKERGSRTLQPTGTEGRTTGRATSVSKAIAASSTAAKKASPGRAGTKKTMPKRTSGRGRAPLPAKKGVRKSTSAS